MDSADIKALERCADLGLHPLMPHIQHHTDVPFTDEDEQVGEALAWFLGCLFTDTSHRYFYHEMTSVDIWRRVARALRVYGMKISDCNEQIFLPPR